MLKPIPILCVALSLVAPMAAAQQGAGASWRSELYPEDWAPATPPDAEGRFLHDFSYAGYGMGERAIPDAKAQGQVIRPGGLDPSGEADCTAAIQAALDQAGEAGGGRVELPAGTFRVRPSGRGRACLEIRHAGVVLAGAGAGKTRLLCASHAMRQASVIAIGRGNWGRKRGRPIAIAGARLANRSTRVPLASVEGIAVGDWLVLRSDVTDAFIAEHGMQGWWQTKLGGPMFYRRVTAIDAGARSITIDIPTRYPLLARDNARVHRVAAHLSGVGVEDLAIGALGHPGKGFGDGDYGRQGTGAYDLHGAHLISMRHVVDGWVRRVRSFRPAANRREVHMHSNGIRLMMCRNVTVADCVIAHPQYEGGGGNGYGFILRGNDCLVTRCRAVSCRHAYDFKSMCTSGNVVHRSSSKAPRLSSDFHMHLSMSNLFDCMTMDGDVLEARVRPYGTIKHGHATTQSVFWNSRGLAGFRGGKTLVVSRQFGHGYVIGTQGPTHGVSTRPTRDFGRETAPEDHVEGVGKGASLVPESLYEDQLERRLARAQKPRR